MPLFTLDQLHDAITLVRTLVPATPAYAWPLLARRTGVQLFVKHENHTPTGSFKARGGLVYIDWLMQQENRPRGLVTATRGNHGQSIAIGGRRAGLPVAIVVPEGNSQEKNAAMAAFGGEVIIAGRDFDESRPIAAELQTERGYHLVPSFHPQLVMGVASYALELFTVQPELEAVYVPIGMGSGICGLITVRDLLGLKTRIVGVVAESADAYARSLEAGRVVTTETARTFADGMACREPQAEALAIIRDGVDHIVTVSDDNIADAMRHLYTDTHNVAEGAGAAALAGLIQEQASFQGQQVAVILCGGNVDAPVFTQVLQGRTPEV